MNLERIIEEEKVCPICETGKLLVMEWEGGFFRKRCELCSSTISNFDFLGGKCLKEPKVAVGYGSLHLAKEGVESEGFFQFNELYDLESFLTKWSYLFTDLKWRNTFEESFSYAYVFDSKTREGKVIWGNGLRKNRNHSLVKRS